MNDAEVEYEIAARRHLPVVVNGETLPYCSDVMYAEVLLREMVESGLDLDGSELQPRAIARMWLECGGDGSRVTMVKTPWRGARM